MTSRSYYAIASGSLLLLLISCTSQSAKRDDARSSNDKVLVSSPVPEIGKDTKEGTSGHVALGPGGPVPSFPAAADDGGGGEAGAVPDDPKSHPDGCALEEMRFEGSCTSKKKVKKILDERADEAIRVLRHAKRPEQKARATTDLLEQQIAQIDKTEDDLDEILEILREERGPKKGGSKKGNF